MHLLAYLVSSPTSYHDIVCPHSPQVYELIFDSHDRLSKLMCQEKTLYQGHTLTLLLSSLLLGCFGHVLVVQCICMIYCPR